MLLRRTYDCASTTAHQEEIHRPHECLAPPARIMHVEALQARHPLIHLEYESIVVDVVVRPVTGNTLQTCLDKDRQETECIQPLRPQDVHGRTPAYRKR